MNTGAAHHNSLSHAAAPLYRWQEGVENLENYCRGGYHPTRVGDSYANGRYEIAHGLDNGAYSTVWLARDHQ